MMEKVCGVCGKKVDIEITGGIENTNAGVVVCEFCVRNHPYRTNRVLT